MNYIARKVPAAAPLPGGGPAASVLLRGRRRRDGRCARQARGRRHLGKPVGDVQIAGPGGARACAARSAGRGGSADRRGGAPRGRVTRRSEEHTSELQSRLHLVCRLLLEKKKKI